MYNSDRKHFQGIDMLAGQKMYRHVFVYHHSYFCVRIDSKQQVVRDRESDYHSSRVTRHSNTVSTELYQRRFPPLFIACTRV